MNIANLDWIIIISFLLLTLLIGLIVSKKSGESSSQFFLSGRNMPWWLLGVSMVATTFSTSLLGKDPCFFEVMPAIPLPLVPLPYDL